MKKLIFTLALTLSSIIATSQNQGEIFRFTGELLNTPATMIDCGNENYAYILEFKVEMFTDEDCHSESIAVIVPCPNAFGDGFFKKGQTYKMEIFITSKGGTYTVPNADVLDNYSLPHEYWAGDIHPIK